MKVVASMQAKRGSSRGLVHYIAHSKLDTEREPQNSRELFNAFSDRLSVKSANNSMKVGIAKGRPSNDELHHLVLSFRSDDYRNLGADEARRLHALKKITREAMKSLETSISARRLLWTAAVHRNTDNPHVHIAIQKQYLSKEIERRTLTKIPRETLPHYEHSDGERVLVPGFLIEAATDKMEAIIEREKSRNREPKRSGRNVISQDHFGRGTESEPIKGSELRIDAERAALARGILAEYELLRIDTRIDSLLDHGAEMRFLVNDPVSGKKKRISLRKIRGKDSRTEIDQPTTAERQIKTILHKMLVKEEASKSGLQNDLSDVLRKAKRIRGEYRKSDRQLPVPSLTKEDLDRLQEQCLEASDIRRFSYLERIRADLQKSGEIEPRSEHDISSIIAQKNISDLRSRTYEKMLREQNERGYYLRFNIGERSLSLADLDREQREQGNSLSSFLKNVKTVAARFSKKSKPSARADETDELRQKVVEKLAEHVAGIQKESSVERNKAKILANVLSAYPENDLSHASHSPEQIAEIEKLSVQLKLTNAYENNWKEQRSIIESAGHDSAAFQKLLKADRMTGFAEHKRRVIAGRSLAREIIARVGFDKTKEELKIFQDGKRFQKFAIVDKQSGDISYLSLHDLDLPRRNSLLDRTIDELFEGREHKILRRTVLALVDDKEKRLKDDVTTAKEIMVSASRNASEFKEFSYFGLKSDSGYQPIFTSSEVAMLELRTENARDPKEVGRLRTILESVADKSERSLTEILRDFENPEKVSAKRKELDLVAEKNPGDSQTARAMQSEQDPVVHRSTTRASDGQAIPDHSR